MQNAWTRFVLSVTDVERTLDYYVKTLGWDGSERSTSQTKMHTTVCI